MACSVGITTIGIRASDSPSSLDLAFQSFDSKLQVNFEKVNNQLDQITEMLENMLRRNGVSPQKSEEVTAYMEPIRDEIEDYTLDVMVDTKIDQTSGDCSIEFEDGVVQTLEEIDAVPEESDATLNIIQCKPIAVNGDGNWVGDTVEGCVALKDTVKKSMGLGVKKQAPAQYQIVNLADTHPLKMPQMVGILEKKARKNSVQMPGNEFLKLMEQEVRKLLLSYEFFDDEFWPPPMISIVRAYEKLQMPVMLNSKMLIDSDSGKGVDAYYVENYIRGGITYWDVELFCDFGESVNVNMIVTAGGVIVMGSLELLFSKLVVHGIFLKIRLGDDRISECFMSISSQLFQYRISILQSFGGAMVALCILQFMLVLEELIYVFGVGYPDSRKGFSRTTLRDEVNAYISTPHRQYDLPFLMAIEEVSIIKNRGIIKLGEIGYVVFFVDVLDVEVSASGVSSLFLVYYLNYDRMRLATKNIGSENPTLEPWGQGSFKVRDVCRNSIVVIKLELRGSVIENEGIMIDTRLLAVSLWSFGEALGITSVVAAMLELSIPLSLGMLDWDDCLSEKSTGYTLAWFALPLGMAGELSNLGIVIWMADCVAKTLESPLLSWHILQAAYFFIHHLYASQLGHIGALYHVFLVMLFAAGVPGVLVALALDYNINLFGNLMHYNSGHVDVYYGAGYLDLPEDVERVIRKGALEKQFSTAEPIHFHLAVSFLANIILDPWGQGSQERGSIVMYLLILKKGFKKKKEDGTIRFNLWAFLFVLKVIGS